MTENDIRTYKCLNGQIVPLPDPSPEVQDYPGLDAGGFLMVALGHLVKAGEKLRQEPSSRAAYKASRWTSYAANYVRRALKLLDEQEEETCEKP